MNKIQKGSFFKHPLIEKILDYPSNIWTFASVSLPLYIYRQNFKVTCFQVGSGNNFSCQQGRIRNRSTLTRIRNPEENLRPGTKSPSKHRCSNQCCGSESISFCHWIRIYINLESDLTPIISLKLRNISLISDGYSEIGAHVWSD